MSERDFADWARSLAAAPAEQIIDAAVARFGHERLALASSGGMEDQVLTHLLRARQPRVGIFTIDTGRLPEETYTLLEETAAAYGFTYDILLPDATELSALLREGPNAFYRSRELRQRCCHARKVAPLQRKLATLAAWFCGLRREQGVTRAAVQTVEQDAANGVVKLNPLAAWSDATLWEYARIHHVPLHPLHAQGYPSIGCAPCTRAVRPGEEARAGRWWWEAPEQKECGLHRRPGGTV